VPALILASSSPRRREILGGLGLRFAVRPVDLDETPHPGEDPAAYVLRLAREKAAALAAPGELVLGADTTVVLDGEILGKPADAADARAMLAKIVGREHTVYTGVALHEPRDPEVERLGSGIPGAVSQEARQESAVERSEVVMAPMSEAEIAWYVATGEPLDKAGSYAVQGIGSLFVEGVRGNFSNVVGLPLPLTYRLFSRLGYDLLGFRS
jgi:septum formation protein